MTWSGTLKLTRNDNLGQFTENWLSFQNCRVPVLPRDLQNKTLFGEKKEFETAFWFPSCQNKKQIILLAKKKKKKYPTTEYHKIVSEFHHSSSKCNIFRSQVPRQQIKPLTLYTRLFIMPVFC